MVCHLGAFQKVMHDLGNLLRVIQEHQALADAGPVRLRNALVQLDEQPQYLQHTAVFITV